MLKYFEIKKAFRYYIKQIDSMLPCVWFSNRSQKTSKCGKNISDTLGYASCATFLFLPHFDVICDLLLNRRTATRNLFVKYIYSFFVFSFCTISLQVFSSQYTVYCSLLFFRWEIPWVKRIGIKSVTRTRQHKMIYLTQLGFTRYVS